MPACCYFFCFLRSDAAFTGTVELSFETVFPVQAFYNSLKSSPTKELEIRKELECSYRSWTLATLSELSRFSFYNLINLTSTRKLNLRSENFAESLLAWLSEGIHRSFGNTSLGQTEFISSLIQSAERKKKGGSYTFAKIDRRSFMKLLHWTFKRTREFNSNPWYVYLRITQNCRCR